MWEIIGLVWRLVFVPPARQRETSKSYGFAQRNSRRESRECVMTVWQLCRAPTADQNCDYVAVWFRLIVNETEKQTSALFLKGESTTHQQNKEVAGKGKLARNCTSQLPTANSTITSIRIQFFRFLESAKLQKKKLPDFFAKLYLFEKIVRLLFFLISLKNINESLI